MLPLLTISGHTVTVLVRDPSKMPAQPGPSTAKGTPTSLADMRNTFALQKPDAVLVTLNALGTSSSPFTKSIAPPRLMADSVANAVTCISEFGVGYVVVMQVWGVGTSVKILKFLMR